MRKVFIFIFVIYSISSAFGQVKTKSKIKVFQTCSHEWLCDVEYLRNELKMVDFVRDRFLCDVQVILNTQFNNAGGEINTISFQGQNDFAAIKDTLSYFNNATATEDVKRRKMLQNLKLGLMQFIAKSPIAEDIEKNIRLTQVIILHKKNLTLGIIGSFLWVHQDFSMETKITKIAT